MEPTFFHPDFPSAQLSDLVVSAESFNIHDHIMSLLFDEPFFAEIFRSLDKRISYKIPTAGVYVVDGEYNFVWNPLFIAAYKPNKVRGLLKHEVFHICLGHTHSRSFNPHRIWNIATDLAINSGIPEDELPPCGFIPGKRNVFSCPILKRFKKPEEETDREKALANFIASLKKDLSAEEYFSIIMENDEIKEIISPDNNGEGASLDGDGEGGGDGGDSLSKGFDEHDGWSDLSEEQAEILAGKMKAIIEAAKNKANASAKGWGSVSSSMREQIQKALSKEVDWRAILRAFVGTTYRDGRTTSIHRLNKKYPGIFPGATRDYKPKIHVYMDQSGSVSDSDITLFFSELISLSTRATFMMYYFDTEVDEESSFVWKRGVVPSLMRTRCGGTDFQAPTRHALNVGCDGYIILTDGLAPKPSHSKIRRAWVITPGSDLEFSVNEGIEKVIRMKKHSR
jgi:predicted metal-dependent peptidase